jgi:hypothetical protein
LSGKSFQVASIWMSTVQPNKFHFLGIKAKLFLRKKLREIADTKNFFLLIFSLLKVATKCLRGLQNNMKGEVEMGQKERWKQNKS